MLPPETIDALAAELADAHRRRSVVPRITARHPQATIEDSYAVQSAWCRTRLAEGHRLTGRKIGLTSKAMQSATGITEPDYGVILDDTVWENGAVVDFDAFSNVRLEVEIAFLLDTPLEGPHCTLFDVLDATRYVVPALEILNSHIELEGRTIVDTIADNAAYGGIVVGGSPTRPHAVDLRWISALLHRNENVEESGVAAAVLGHPARAVAWLANKLHQHGGRLGAGELVLAGSFTRPIWISRGDVVLCDYGPMGTISCRFR
ncbi:2-oxo-hepta-3-ene-1,7-dioate hydratase [Streptomyces sp. NPDC050560]|uniref:2-oxo-hepta-3-ene-1,7-dioate hydratase n=1 Tax=Streptomyces sp. NPDC050560 TaxID=3365630 RepID=UPI0037B9DB29